MKKLFFTLAIVLGAVTVSAQNSGNMWLGGSVGFSHQKDKEGDFSAKTTSFNVLPEFGYFFQDNLAIAVRVGYEHSKVTTPEWNGTDYEDVSTKTNAFVINPFLRYTFLKGSIGCLFVDGGVHAKFGKQWEENMTEFGVGITPGAVVNIGNGFALTAAFGKFGYSHKQVKTDPKYKSDKFDFGFKMDQVSVGMSYNF